MINLILISLGIISIIVAIIVRIKGTKNETDLTAMDWLRIAGIIFCINFFVFWLRIIIEARF